MAFRKIRGAIFVVSLLMALTLISCSKKEAPVNQKPDEKTLEFIFSSILNNKAPAPFTRLMLHRELQRDKTVLYLYEKIYPQCSGILETRNLYSPALDDGKWVDDLLFLMEEERFGSEVLNLLEDESVMQEPIVQPQEEQSEQKSEQETDERSDSEQRPVEAEAVEKRLLDSYNRLKVMEYGNERFLPVNANSSKILVHYSDKKAVRYFYDEQFRLVKKEYWNMPAVADSKITVTEQYEYNENGKLPSKKIIENDNSKLVSIFNDNGLVIESKKYEITGKDDERSERIINLTKYEYDDKERLVQEKSTVYKYSDKKLTGTNEKKQLYIYKNEDEAIPPDYEYYEDNVLRTKTEYTEKDKYMTLIVFDRENSVQTYYENHIKVKDVYYTNGVERRVKLYE